MMSVLSLKPARTELVSIHVLSTTPVPPMQSAQLTATGLLANVPQDSQVTLTVAVCQVR